MRRFSRSRAFPEQERGTKDRRSLESLRHKPIFQQHVFVDLAAAVCQTRFPHRLLIIPPYNIPPTGKTEFLPLNVAYVHYTLASMKTLSPTKKFPLHANLSTHSLFASLGRGGKRKSCSLSGPGLPHTCLLCWKRGRKEGKGKIFWGGRLCGKKLFSSRQINSERVSAANWGDQKKKSSQGKERQKSIALLP